MDEMDNETFAELFREMLPKQTVKIPNIERYKSVVASASKIRRFFQDATSPYLLDGEQNPTEFKLDSAPLIDSGITLTVTIPDFGADFATVSIKELLTSIPECRSVSVRPRTDDRVDIAFVFPSVYNIISAE